MKTLDYNMTADYCGDWSAIDAIREMVQNALDSNKDYECTASAHGITVVTKDVVLPMDVFSLGMSRKADSQAIGKYGEGFKIGMMVLTRLGLKPVIHTGTYMIAGEFIENSVTGLNTFNLVFHEQATSLKDTIFVCDATGIDQADLEHKITPFAEHALPKVRKDLEILYTRPGDIYVNGLWVCHKPELTYGYNFAPGYIQLNRDRNMVEGTLWQLGKYYGNLDSNSAELIFRLIKADAADVADVSYHLSYNNDLKAELARLFYNEYGDGAKIGRPGSSYYGSSYTSMSHSGYRTMAACGVKEAKQSVDADSPQGILTAFATRYRKHLRRDVRTAVDTLITQSKGWKK